MKRLSVAPVIGLLLAATLVPAATAAPGTVGRYIVVLHDGVDAPAVAREHAARFGAVVGYVYGTALDGYAAAIPDVRLAMLRADPRVALVSEDRAVTTLGTVMAGEPVPAVVRDARAPSNPTETIPTGITRAKAPAGSAGATGIDQSGAPFVVAVIDTGIDPTHPDLNVVGGVNCSSGSSWADGNGHGSHVAGTIGAKQNGTGVVGMAPGVPLVAVRVLNNAGSGTWSSVACGIDWVAANAAGSAATGNKPIRIANMSLGGTGTDSRCEDDALHLAICNATDAGVLFTVAAGNDAANFATFVPATYAEVLTVTAMADFDGLPGALAKPTCRTDQDDTAADFSNWVTTSNTADQAHTIVAPGVCIRSTYKSGGYATLSGTSMASPHAAGAAALYLIKNPTATRDGIRSGVMSKAYSATFTSGGTKYFGKMLDASF